MNLTPEQLAARLGLRPDQWMLVDGKVRPVVAGGDGPDDETPDPAIAELEALITSLEEAETPEARAEILAALDDAALADLEERLVAYYADARPNVTTDVQANALEAVARTLTAIRDDAGRRLDEAEALQERLQTLDGEVHVDDVDGDAANTGAGDHPDDAPGGEGDTGAGDQGGDTSGATQQAAARPAGGRRPAPALGSLARGSARRGAPSRELNDRTAEGEPARLRARAFANLDEVAQGHHFTMETLGASLASLAGSLRVDQPSLRKHYVGSVPIGDDPRLVRASDPEFSGSSPRDLVDEAVRRNVARKQELAAEVASGRRVASGGPCVAPTPDYTINVVGDRGTPFVDSLATIVEKRPMMYYQPLEVDIDTRLLPSSGDPVASAGGTNVTASQDTAGYGDPNADPSTVPEGGAALKDCVKIDCPTPVTLEPEAVFRCVQYGNWQAISFPEYVSAFDEVTSIYFDTKRDETAIAKILDKAQFLHAASNTFGAAVDLLHVMRVVADSVRSRRRAPGLTFEVYAPFFTDCILADDLAATWSGSTLDNLRAAPSSLMGLLAAEDGLMLNTYDVSAGTTIGGSPTILPKLNGTGVGPGNATAIPSWPSEIRIIMWASGSVFHQTQGDLRFGLRETLMGENDFASFEEIFETTGTRGTDIYVIDVPICTNGARGALVSLDCFGG